MDVVEECFRDRVLSVCALYRPREWMWVDSNSKNRKSTFRRAPSWSQVFIDLYC